MACPGRRFENEVLSEAPDQVEIFCTAGIYRMIVMQCREMGMRPVTTTPLDILGLLKAPCVPWLSHERCARRALGRRTKM
jgi:hypothetical protein